MSERVNHVSHLLLHWSPSGGYTRQLKPSETRWDETVVNIRSTRGKDLLAAKFLKILIGRIGCEATDVQISARQLITADIACSRCWRAARRTRVHSATTTTTTAGASTGIISLTAGTRAAATAIRTGHSTLFKKRKKSHSLLSQFVILLK